MFIHLHGHSQYSLLEGIGSIPNIIKKAQDLGMSAIGITDYYALYGALEFYTKSKKADIGAIIGVELPLVQDINTKTGSFEHLGFITIIANNHQGYSDLLRLVSEANTTGFYHKPRVDSNLIKKHGNDFTILIGGEHSIIGRQLHLGQSHTFIDTILQSLHDVVNGNLIIEYYVQHYETVPLAKSINEYCLRLQDNYILTCGNNYHYINADEHEPFEVALAIKDQKLIYDQDRRKIAGLHHIMSEDEIITILQSHGLNPQTIDNMIQATATQGQKLIMKMPQTQAMFPSYTPPEEISSIYEQVKHTLIETQN